MKTKIGLSVGVASALMYAIGLLGIIPTLLAAGYVLIAERDKTLRRSAIITLSVVVAVGVLLALLGILDNLFGFFNTFISWGNTTFRLKYPGDFDNLFKYAAFLIRDILLIVLLIISLCRTGSLKNNINEMTGAHEVTGNRATPSTPESENADSVKDVSLAPQNDENIDRL